MSGPFKMKGSGHYGHGNQHSKGKAAPKMYDAPTDFNAKLRAADLPEGKFKDAVDASGAKYASPTKTDEGRETVKKYASGEKEVTVKGDTRTAAELLALAEKAEKDGNKPAADKMRDKAAKKASEGKRAQEYLGKTS